MEKIKVTCDSTCDLSDKLYNSLDVTVLPLYVMLGDEQYRDGVDINSERLSEYTEKTGLLPKSAAVSVGDYVEVFEKYTSQGYKIIHINISSKISSCYQNACIAAETVGNVFVIDSLNLSSGSGHLVMAAAELASQGVDAQNIANMLNEMKHRLEVSFVIERLDNLYKGGRCSALSALGANILKLKPCIEVKNGTMGMSKKFRGGDMEKILLQYVEYKLKDREDIQKNRIFITHTNVSESIINSVISQINAFQKFKEIIVTDAGATIGTHCGKGTLGILFFRK